MKKYTLFIFLLSLSYCLLTACSDDDGSSTPNLTVGKETVDFKSEAGSQNVSITTNVDAWTAKADKNWCHPSIDGQALRISVDESEERYVREATVTIVAADLVETIKVRQLGYEPAILVDQPSFKVGVIGGEIQFNVTTNVEVEIKIPEWITPKSKTRAPAMVTTDHAYTVKATDQDQQRHGNIEITEILPSTGADTEQAIPMTASVSIIQKGLNEYAEGDGEDIKGDIKIKVVSGKASSAQSGSDIEKSFDGDYSTLYHSNWSNKGDNYFPITLTYNFESTSEVDYLVYHPRSSGNNGLFKEVDIEYSEDGSTFTSLISKDFQGSATISKVRFDQPVRAKSFRFTVKSGAGDGQGFASCAEMEFFQKNPKNFDYSTLFTDETCSELKSGITEADIEQCEYPFFKNMAYYMMKGKYPSEFRINEFKAYPHPDIQSKTHKTNPYSRLDNPTGIAVNANENLIVFVGDTHGYDIALRVQNLDVPAGDGFGGISYPLSQGTNKIAISEKGLVYVMYHTKTLDEPNAKPIKIHFASGTVNGYFDSQNPKHAGRWSELLNKAADRYFDVLGKYAHLTFETSDFRTYAGPGTELIDLYDKIAYSEMQLMGLEKFDKMFRNRMYLNVIYKDYMYATSYHTAYNRTTMGEICNPEKLKTNACWGPAHEIGHCNQTRPGLLWGGTTEVTNNIMSEYIQTTIFNQPSRVQVEDMGIVYRNRYSKAWSGIIATGSPHADFKNVGNSEDDVFCKLIPFWQLELYFGKVLGRTPLQQADKGGFYPEIYEYVRNKDYSSMTHGEIQLDFVYASSKISGMNLLDFFTKWGFLTPVDKELNDYGKKQMTVTQEMIDALIQKVNALGLPKPDVALEYISDNTYELYKTKPAIVKGENATHSPKTFTLGNGENAVTYNGESITIKNWQNVVTYEVKDEAGKYVLICSGENTPSSTDTFTLPVRWKEGFKLYAVPVIGEKIEIPMN